MTNIINIDDCTRKDACSNLFLTAAALLHFGDRARERSLCDASFTAKRERPGGDRERERSLSDASSTAKRADASIRSATDRAVSGELRLSLLSSSVTISTITSCLSRNDVFS